MHQYVWYFHASVRVVFSCISACGIFMHQYVWYFHASVRVVFSCISACGIFMHQCVWYFHASVRVVFSCISTCDIFVHQYVWYFHASVRVVFSCIQTLVGCQCLGFLTCAQMLMHAIAHGGCADTVRESALEVGSSGRSIPCRTGDSNPRLAFQS